MRRPRGAVPDGAARVLVAVVRDAGTTTVREVMAATGYQSTSTVHEHLKRWRREGIVTWAARAQGTLRAACVPIRPPTRGDDDG